MGLLEEHGVVVGERPQLLVGAPLQGIADGPQAVHGRNQALYAVDTARGDAVLCFFVRQVGQDLTHGLGVHVADHRYRWHRGI